MAKASRKIPPIHSHQGANLEASPEVEKHILPIYSSSVHPPVGWEAQLPHTRLPRISRRPHKEICSHQLHLPKTSVDYCFINRAEGQGIPGL